MACFSPISIVDPKGNHPSQRILVPCGKCLDCLSVRRDSWTIRLKHELRNSISAHFITLTYDDDSLVFNDLGYPIVVKKDVQDFMKRLRKRVEPNKIRYFCVSEYGENTLRPHYHMILFNFPLNLDLYKTLEQTWSLGHFHIGKVTQASIHYTTKYCLAYEDEEFRDAITDVERRERPFMLCSRRPAIGSNYLSDKNIDYHKNGLKNYLVDSGRKIPLPRYYRERIFDDDEIMKINVKTKLRIDEQLREYDKKYEEYDKSVIGEAHPMKIQKELEWMRRVRYSSIKNQKF